MKPIFFSLLFVTLLSCSEGDSESSADSVVSQGKQTISIPLSEKGKWEVLEFGSKDANQVSFTGSGVSIDVNGSASPLIYPLTDKPLNIKTVSLEVEVDKLVSISNPEKQGTKGMDDFNIRFGLVILGSKKLSKWQKLIAPDWVKKLFRLVPDNIGVKHTYFLNATLSPSLLHKEMEHPSTEYVIEKNAWLMDKTGSFSYSYTFPEAQPTGALWISSDGDDTKSSYNIKIEKITLETE